MNLSREQLTNMKSLCGVLVLLRASPAVFCLLEHYPFTSFSYNDSVLADAECNGTTVCVRKCCALGYVPVHKTCVANDTATFRVPIHDGRDRLTNESFDYLYLSGVQRCESGKYYLLDPDAFEDDVSYVQRNGNLWEPETGETLSFDEFCVDHFEGVGLTGLICSPPSTWARQTAKTVNRTGMIISMPFLLLTFFIYAILPDRNIHAKSLMCYVSSLFGAYILLVFIQLYPNDLSPVNCKTLGMFCLFFFMVSFYWINVMSIDIWWTFSGLRGFSGSKREAERKRFLLYCGYAWGMPLLHAILVISLTLSSSVPKNTWYNPAMGDGQCWLREGIPTLIYFYGPMATLIVINITLFCVTACKIKQVQQDTAVLRKDESKKHSYENDKQRFNLYLKLMLAMGVNWSMEIISWAVDWQVGHVPPAVWYITDFCNALYGVFVFFIFVFKKKIWQLLKKRYYMLIGKPHLARTMTQNAYSPRTTATSLSQCPANEKSFVNDSSVLTSEVA